MAVPTIPSALRLPTVLLRQGIALRAERDDDTPFLMALCATTRAQELALLDWDAARKQLFLAQQFTAQRHHYRHALEGCQFHVIERRGDPIGRVCLQERASERHIVDILLLPDETGRGIGTGLLRAILADAARRGKSVGLEVEKSNPARRLYRRLGFVQTGDSGFRVRMERRATVG